ncbi:MAG: hypothetical protein H5T84_10575, partial [Thermoleophilia bacterium]|nr:hypothetical protein [Thermoleophilia bacterium]
EINRLLAELSACERELAAASQRAREYPNLMRELQDLETRLGEVEREERRLREALGERQRLLDLWPLWVDIRSARDRLASLEPVEEFISDPVRRLTEAKEGLDAARRARERLEEQWAQKRAAAESLRNGLRSDLLALGPAIQKQAAALAWYRDRRQELGTLSARLKEEEKRLEEVLHELGPEVDETALGQIDASLPRSERIRQWKEQLREATADVEQARMRWEQAVTTQTRLEQERDREREILSALQAPDPAVVEQRRQALRVLRAGLARWETHRATLTAEAQFASVLETALGRKPQEERRRRVSRLAIWSAAVAVLLLAGGVTAFAAWDAVSWGALLCVLGVAAGVLAAVVAYRGSHGADANSAVATLQREWARQREAQKLAREEFSRLEMSLREAAATLGWNRLPDQYELEGEGEKLAAMEQLLVRWQDQKQKVDQVEEELRLAFSEEQAAREAYRQAEEDLRTLREEFGRYLHELRLPPSLSPEGAEEYLRAVRNAKERVRQRDQIANDLARITQQLREWEEATARVLAATGAATGVATRAAAAGSAGTAAGTELGPLPSGAAREGSDRFAAASALLDRDLPSALQVLVDAWEAAKAEESKLTTLEDSLRELSADLELARSAEKEKEEQWQSLLAQAGVEDEDGFLRKLEVFEQRRQLKQQIVEREDQIT